MNFCYLGRYLLSAFVYACLVETWSTLSFAMCAQAFDPEDTAQLNINGDRSQSLEGVALARSLVKQVLRGLTVGGSGSKEDPLRPSFSGISKSDANLFISTPIDSLTFAAEGALTLPRILNNLINVKKMWRVLQKRGKSLREDVMPYKDQIYFEGGKTLAQILTFAEGVYFGIGLSTLEVLFYGEIKIGGREDYFSPYTYSFLSDLNKPYDFISDFKITVYGKTYSLERVRSKLDVKLNLDHITSIRDLISWDLDLNGLSVEFRDLDTVKAKRVPHWYGYLLFVRKIVQAAGIKDHYAFDGEVISFMKDTGMVFEEHFTRTLLETFKGIQKNSTQPISKLQLISEQQVKDVLSEVLKRYGLALDYKKGIVSDTLSFIDNVSVESPVKGNFYQLIYDHLSQTENSNKPLFLSLQGNRKLTVGPQIRDVKDLPKAYSEFYHLLSKLENLSVRGSTLAENSLWIEFSNDTMGVENNAFFSQNVSALLWLLGRVNGSLAFLKGVFRYALDELKSGGDFVQILSFLRDHVTNFDGKSKLLEVSFDSFLYFDPVLKIIREKTKADYDQTLLIDGQHFKPFRTRVAEAIKNQVLPNLKGIYKLSTYTLRKMPQLRVEGYPETDTTKIMDELGVVLYLAKHGTRPDESALRSYILSGDMMRDFLWSEFNFRAMDSSEIAQLSARFGLHALLEKHPHDFMMALSVFNKRGRIGNIQNLIPAYGYIHAERQPPPSNSSEILKELTKVVTGKANFLEDIPLKADDVDMAALEEYLLKHLRLRHHSNYHSIILEIDELLESIQSDDVKSAWGDVSIYELEAVCQSLRSAYVHLQESSVRTDEFLTKPLPHQRESIEFLVRRKGAVLADDVGLGKTSSALFAASQIGAKKTVIVTRATLRTTMLEELKKHRKPGTFEVYNTEGMSASDRSAVLSRQPGFNDPDVFIILSYNVLPNLQDTDLELLNQNLDLVILDEGHYAENEETLRYEALKRLESGRMWLLSATPYQSKPENLFSLLDLLEPSEKWSKENFERSMQDEESIKQFRLALKKYILYRSKEEVVDLFEDPAHGKSLEEQIQEKRALLPRIIYEEPIRAELSLTQTRATMHLQSRAHFSQFMKSVNKIRNDEGKDRYSETPNGLNAFGRIQDVMYRPNELGLNISLNDDAVLRETFGRVVDGIVNEGFTKVVVYTWNTAVQDKLLQLLASHGAVGLGGNNADTNGINKATSLQRFREDSNVKVIVVNYVSAGEGLSLYADLAVFSQIPPKYPKLLQALGRPARIITGETLHLARHQVKVAMIMPVHTEENIEICRKEDRRLDSVANHLTQTKSIVSQLLMRLEGGKILYELMLKGHPSVGYEDLSAYLSHEIMSQLLF